jgi:hypothetical protein
MSESFFSEQPQTSRTASAGRATFDSAVSIDSGGASEVIHALRSVFAVGELTNTERDALRTLVVQYMRAVRRRDIPPERALVFVKVLTHEAKSAQDRCELTGGGASRPVDSIRRFDCREYYDELTRQIVGWAIEAYYSPERVD